MPDHKALSEGYLKAIGGLIAVVVGILAVTGLALVTLWQLDTENQEGMVAVTSSAFGIISAVVGAYLGIKISAETSAKASEEVKHATGTAAVAQHEASQAHQEVTKVKGAAAEVLEPEQKQEFQEKLAEADPPPPAPPDPPQQPPPAEGR
jgi:hypothetical protein